MVGPTTLHIPRAVSTPKKNSAATSTGLPNRSLSAVRLLFHSLRVLSVLCFSFAPAAPRALSLLPSLSRDASGGAVLAGAGGDRSLRCSVFVLSGLFILVRSVADAKKN